jgi:hypothetical protein
VLALAKVDALGARNEHADVVGVDIREAGQREDLRADLDAAVAVDVRVQVKVVVALLAVPIEVALVSCVWRVRRWDGRERIGVRRLSG